MKDQYCKICQKNQNFEHVVDIPNQRPIDFKDQKFFSYSKCPICSYYLLDPIIDQKDIEKIYQKEEYYQNLAESPKSTLLNSLFQFKIFSSNQDFTKQFLNKQEKLLDIGCGNGQFLQSLTDQGYDVYGIDPYPVAVQNTKKRIGDQKVFSGYVKDLEKIEQKFDVITMWHVLEHVQDPLQDLRIIYKSLNDNGKIIFEVPNADSQAFKIFGPDYNYNMVPEHIQYFNPKSATIALEKAGFTVVKCYTPPRALLNFALSFKNKFKSKINTKIITIIYFLIATPISALLIFLSSLIDRGEVLRVVAVKDIKVSSSSEATARQAP